MRRFEMTEDQYHHNLEELVGFCLTCGAEHDNTEPDATAYPCDRCQASTVYGVEELLFMDELEILGDP